MELNLWVKEKLLPPLRLVASLPLESSCDGRLPVGDFHASCCFRSGCRTSQCQNRLPKQHAPSQADKEKRKSEHALQQTSGATHEQQVPQKVSKRPLLVLLQMPQHSWNDVSWCDPAPPCSYDHWRSLWS